MTVDPDHAFWRPRFARGGASVDDVIDLFAAGEPRFRHGDEDASRISELITGVSRPQQLSFPA